MNPLLPATPWVLGLVLLVIVGVPFLLARVVGDRDSMRDAGPDGSTPPSWVFPIMWSTLYTLLAVILYRLLTQPKQNPAVITAIALFAVGIALNWAWIPTAQTEHWDESLAIIVAMLIVAFPTLMSLQTVDKTSALLFAPYLAWLVYATYLNARTTELKRKSA